jgi:hemerythrin
MSDFFEWDAKFDLGVGAMDSEHRMIVDAMNQLHRLHEGHAPAAEQMKVMTRLVDVTKRHFADEEAYMEKLGFPDLRKHRNIHVLLLERLGQYEAAMRAKGAASQDLFDFLKMWLKAHICGIDTKYAAYGKVA